MRSGLKTMKRAFTLIELLVVVLVMASLIGIVFRLAGLVGAQTARTETVVKLQKLENCLSGYYAVFGNYPPVKLHGSRNIFCKVNGYGIQQVSKSDQPGVLNWEQVDAACKSQPVAMNYPYDEDMLDYIDKISEILKKKHDAGIAPFSKNPKLAYLFDGLRNPAMLSGKMGETEWTSCQLYRFGLLSFLLPRYVVMMTHVGEGWDNDGNKIDRNFHDQFAQWTRNNQTPQRFEDGTYYANWATLANEDKWKVMLIPSQAVTQRWAPNLDDDLVYEDGAPSEDDYQPQLYSAADSQSGSSAVGSQQYVLDGATIRDCFTDEENPGGYEIYYYSPRPYQTYRLWSAGPNHKTFPPWGPEETIRTLSSADQQTVLEWISDDIVKMKQ